MLSSLGIDLPTAILLCLAILLALSFEFVNGFHDTANAVATVIYTHTLKPNQAVVWSGMWNLIGVLTSSGRRGLRHRRAAAGGTGDQCRIRRRLRHGVCAAAFVDHLEPGHLVPGPAGLQLTYLDRLDRRRRFDELPDEPGQRIRRRRQLGQGGRHGQGADFFAAARIRARRRCCCWPPRRCCAIPPCTRRPKATSLPRFGSAGCWC